MKKITEINCFGRTFIVARDEKKMYWAFEDCNIGKNGELLKEFNGITGFMDKDINAVIKRVNDHCYIQLRMFLTGQTAEQIVMEMIHDELREVKR